MANSPPLTENEVRYQNAAYAAENERLRERCEAYKAALQRIVDEAESDDGLSAWDGSEIARAALGQQEDKANG